MTDQDYELLSQYLDGELDSGEARALKRRLLAEPALRGDFEAMKRADLRLRTALHSETASRVPQQVQSLLSDNAAGAAGRRAGWGFALAASVLVASGVLVTAWQGGGENRGAQLAAVLETAPSRGDGWERLDGGERVRAVLSFRAADGNWCREYLAEGGAGAERGVACRVEGNWEVVVSTAVALSRGGADYRPAGAVEVDPIASFIDSRAADIPLGVEEEAALIERGWR